MQIVFTQIVGYGAADTRGDRLVVHLICLKPGFNRDLVVFRINVKIFVKAKIADDRNCDIPGARK